ncbi:HU family DNA-binding protein [Phycicoccus sp. CSK15P-2]|uniref:HU family DNA-binding protein n=1 Tax=Phycicoccus sp. CSK15P-2 TaxID=2807627 RepID=UPI00194F9995|nr:HU family DNA-binding protein [Phycicoccus sp. CSK15P-2]MBM6404802.1 HU family DNA-binding protein [Phycicoccus sp. CSK15P-2]
MNKADLVRELEKTLGSRKAAVEALDTVFDTIVREVVRGGKVAITGFGTFDRVDRAARTGRNPRTGDAVRIPKGRSPRFRPGTAFKDYVRKPSTVPKTGTATGRAPAGSATKDAAATKKAASAKKAASKKTASAKKTTATKAAAKKSATQRAAAKKSAASKATASTAKKSTVKKAATTRKASAASTGGAKKTGAKRTAKKS